MADTVSTAQQDTPIIDGHMIRAWKEHIHTAFPDLSSAQKAVKLAEKVHHALYAQMPDFPASVKRDIVKPLLKIAFEQPDLSIRKDELLYQMLDSGEMGNKEVFQLPLAKWLSHQTGYNCSVDDIAELQHKIQQMKGSGLNPSSFLNLNQAAEMILNARKSREDLREATEQTAAAALPLSDDPLASKGTRKNEGWGAIVKRWSTNRKLRSGLAASAVMLAAAVLLILFPRVDMSAEAVELPEAPIFEHYHILMIGKREAASSLPAEYRYRSIEENKLREWLQARNSMLAESPYFEAIIQSAENAYIHPFVLFAVTGQEQGFVPKDHEEAKQIANNPFNVYHSWKDYNTTIEDSSRIAAKTINNLSRNRPDHIPVLQWINRKYAEDPNWWIGVESLFRQMLSEIETAEPSQPPNLL